MSKILWARQNDKPLTSLEKHVEFIEQNRKERSMDKKYLLSIKTDLGLCVDVLTAIFFCAFVNKVLGIVYFVVALIIDLVDHARELLKIKTESVCAIPNERGPHGGIK